ncbi:hypothetical protein [Ureaplasma canigenitalium]|uniref:hypothetical protein n=1 Tax=Ureaplasma canigenitalium TaxID=42092 RepID=UPI0004E13260|nr:hypothetical protein [Ureaplasma canigenitalium]
MEDKNKNSIFERSKVKETSVFDLNDIEDDRPLEEYTIEELEYSLEYEDLDKKKRDKIKRIIKEKNRQ